MRVWSLLLTIPYSSFFFFSSLGLAWCLTFTRQTQNHMLLNFRRFQLQSDYLLQGISCELANEVSTQMLPDELKCLWLHFSMKTHTALYPTAINLPALSTSASVTQVALLGTPAHLPCCQTPVCSLKTPTRCCLLQERGAFFVPMWGPALHVSHHAGMGFSCPCPGLCAICRKTPYGTCVSIPSAHDSIQSKSRHKYLLRLNRLNSFAESINSCRHPFMILSFSVCCLQLSRVLTTLIQIMIGSTSK